MAFSAMVGLGESYLPAFTLELGYGPITAGLVATLPMLAGALFQLATPAAVRLLNSHRRWVVCCAALQALTFVPLISGALAGQMDLPLIYLTASLYWGLGMSTGPAWMAWASTIVPARIRPAYFARRSRYSQASLVCALLAGGAILNLDAGGGDTFPLFALVFLFALGARMLSVTCLVIQSELSPVPIGESRISPVVIRDHIRTGGHGRLLLFLLVFQFSVWVAAPYFTPYMLGPLGLSYAEFTALTASAFLARVLVLQTLGRLVRIWGTKKMLSIASIGIVPFPALWLVDDSFIWLLLLQLASGSAWAAFELASLLAFFERIPPHGQTSILTVYNLASALSIVLGSALGGWLMNVTPDGANPFAVVLLISVAARTLSLGLLRGVSDVPTSRSSLPMRTLSVRPSSGGVLRPVLSAEVDNLE
jgi:MFS family permease